MQFFLSEYPQDCEAVAGELLGVQPDEWPECTSSPYMPPGPRLRQATLYTYKVFGAYFMARAPEFRDVSLLDGSTNSNHWVFTHPKSPVNKLGFMEERLELARKRIDQWFEIRKANGDLNLRDALYGATASVAGRVELAEGRILEETKLVREQLERVEAQLKQLNAKSEAQLGLIQQLLGAVQSIATGGSLADGAASALAAAGETLAEASAPTSNESATPATDEGIQEGQPDMLSPLPNFASMTFYDAASVWFDKGYHDACSAKTAKQFKVDWGWSQSDLNRLSKWKKVMSFLLYHQDVMGEPSTSLVAMDLDLANGQGTLAAALGQNKTYNSLTNFCEALKPGLCSGYDDFVCTETTSPYGMHAVSGKRKPRPAKKNDN